MFAVLDTETNLDNELISIGIVVSDENFNIVDECYYVVTPECEKPAMYSSVVFHKDSYDLCKVDTRVEVIDNIKRFLKKNRVNKLFAYNAKFDFGILPELRSYTWFDIMRVAAYKQFNPTITDDMCCCGSGRLKRGYGVEPTLQRLLGDSSYREIHNALSDARDEFMIMKLLEYNLDVYEIGKIV